MADPRVKSREQVWMLDGKEVPPPEAGIGIGPFTLGGSNQDAQLVEFITYENGEVWARRSPDGGQTWAEPVYLEMDSTLATNYRAGQSDPEKPPPTSNGMQWNPETSRYDIPIGTKSSTQYPINVWPEIAMPDGSIVKYNPADFTDTVVWQKAPGEVESPWTLREVGGNLYQVNTKTGQANLVMDKTQTPGYQAPTPAAPRPGTPEWWTEQNAQTQARIDAIIKEEEALVTAGVKESPAAQRDAKAKIDMLLAEHESTIRRAEKEADWTLGQGERDKANARADAQLGMQRDQYAASERRAAEQANMQKLTTRASVLGQQQQQTNSLLDKGMALGVPVSAAGYKAMTDPYQEIWAILDALKGGQMAPMGAPSAPPGIPQAPSAPQGMAPQQGAPMAPLGVPAVPIYGPNGPVG